MSPNKEDVMSKDVSSENTPPRGKRNKEHYQRIGSLGGNIIKERYGTAYFATIGRKGGTSTKALFGRAHYQQMGKRGGEARRRKD